jgi:uncharacterized damage-inducible protein DinB
MSTLTEISARTLLVQWREVRESVHECLKRTPDKLLSWAPQDGMRTLGQLYVHFSSSLDWWLTVNFKDGGPWIPSNQRPTTERAKLDNDLVASFERMGKFLGSGDLSRTYEYRGQRVDGYWATLHLFEHDTHHRGQVITYLRTNGIDSPEV